MHLAIEIVDTRFKTFGALDPLRVIARTKPIMAH
jgi:hypothetical protein